jgi:hypothetical protein
MYMYYYYLLLLIILYVMLIKCSHCHGDQSAITGIPFYYILLNYLLIAVNEKSNTISTWNLKSQLLLILIKSVVIFYFIINYSIIP